MSAMPMDAIAQRPFTRIAELLGRANRYQKEKRPARKILTGRSFILTSIVDVIRLNQADAGGATGTA